MSRSFNNSQRIFIWSRQNSKCGSCGKSLAKEVDVEYHHILNYKDGGASIVENAVMLCAECHSHCHDYNFQKSVLVYKAEFKYANWEENSFYRGRKKGKEVEFTKKTLDEFDRKYERTIMTDSYDNQLRMLDDFGRNLVALRASSINLRDKYKRQIDVMGSAGFMKDYTSVLEIKYYRLYSKIEDINEMIERQNSKLNNHKEIISNLKLMARND